MAARETLRFVFIALLVLSALTVGISYVTAGTESTFESHLGDSGVADRSDQIVPPRENITVIATDSNSWLGKQGDSPRARSELIAFRSDGSTLYYNDTHTRYWDVDPVPGTKTTVEYLYADHINKSTCPSQAEYNASEYGVSQEVWDEYYAEQSDVDACTRNGIERVNLTTGEVTDVWSQITPGKHATRWHDGDRINKSHYAVADIYLDRVFVVNTETDRISWTWNASDAFDPATTGGPHPDDWTHINDVEVLQDGRFMVDLRNHDRVVFVNPGEGVQEDWTLGEENNYSVLYEQHNPDYIPSDQGGPAVVVADSENNRVIEYQRKNGEWVQTWKWRDARMQWPRDADRLPNGHTLIADSNGNRVFEVNKQGKVVWSVNVAFPYEAERLGTGDESENGPSAIAGNVRSRDPPLDEQFWIEFKNLLPGKYLNGLMYITPIWLGITELFALFIGLLSLVGLMLLKIEQVVDQRMNTIVNSGIFSTRDDD